LEVLPKLWKIHGKVLPRRMNVETKHFYVFGRFRIDPEERVLLRDGTPVPLGPKVFETLLLLIQNAGHLVDKDDLIKRVWPDAFVEEGNLNKHIFVLRKVLGQWDGGLEYIETVPRRGYRFVAPVNQIKGGDESSQPRIPAGGHLTGKKASHYRVLEILGGGGMGLVYKAEDIKLGRRVALKFLPEELASDPVSLERFEREARAASALNHPNICTIYAIEEHGGQPFIAMELLEGGTLRELVSATTLSSRKDSDQMGSLQLDKLLDIAIQVTCGLDAAHRKGIIHRDIKPANVFVTSQGQAKILDFGLAKLQEFDTVEPHRSPLGERAKQEWDPNLTLTRTGVTIGTAGYMSPEQVRGDKLDARTDLFSFGMVLYEMATGQRAFAGETVPLLREAILNHTPQRVRELNCKIPSKLEIIINKALEKDRDLRYQDASEMRADLMQLKRHTESERTLAVVTNAKTQARSKEKRSWIPLISVALLFIGLASAVFLLRRAPALTEKDTIVLADFTNATGESVFDTSLKQALAVELGQSPFLNIFPESSVRETLRYMGRSPDDRVTGAIMSEICERRGIKAMLTGSISSLGRNYIIGVEARNCRTGELLAQQQVEVQGKEQVLRGVDKAASKLRARLGESLSSLQKFDSPIEQATTPSFEALQAYSLAQQQRARGAEYEAIPFLKRAIELDPNFPMANGLLGTMYDHLGDDRSVEYLKKAFDLRERTSEREKLYISAHYYEGVTHDLDKQIETYELWKRMYPRDAVPYTNLGSIYRDIGNYEEAAANARAGLRLAPDNLFPYGILANAYLGLNRWRDAEAVCDQAVAKKLDGRSIQWLIYNIAFIQDDRATMQRQIEWAKSKGEEPGVLFFQGLSAAYSGKLHQSRQFITEAITLRRAGHTKGPPEPKESTMLIQQALIEAQFGYLRRAREQTVEITRAIPQADQNATAVLLALTGDVDRAQIIIDRSSRRFPEDTSFNYLLAPSVRAAIEISRNNASRAVELLWPTVPYELGADADLLPIYLRGQAYLRMQAGKEAALEFQKIVDHRGVAPYSPLHALALPGLARAYALQGDTANSRVAYQNFFAFWKDADRDIPVLKEAKSEYAKLK